MSFSRGGWACNFQPGSCGGPTSFRGWGEVLESLHEYSGGVWGRDVRFNVDWWVWRGGIGRRWCCAWRGFLTPVEPLVAVKRVEVVPENKSGRAVSPTAFFWTWEEVLTWAA